MSKKNSIDKYVDKRGIRKEFEGAKKGLSMEDTAKALRAAYPPKFKVGDRVMTIINWGHAPYYGEIIEVSKGPWEVIDGLIIEWENGSVTTERPFHIAHAPTKDVTWDEGDNAFSTTMNPPRKKPVRMVRVGWQVTIKGVGAWPIYSSKGEAERNRRGLPFTGLRAVYAKKERK